VPGLGSAKKRGAAVFSDSIAQIRVERITGTAPAEALLGALSNAGADLTGARDPSAENVSRKTLLAELLTESLTGEIRRLGMSRQKLYGTARLHRRAGQLIPASVCNEMVENETQLRRAIDRYAQLTLPA
jgi:hypothetical protein